MQKVEVNIVRLIKGFANNENYAVILKERNGSKRIPIVIDFMQAHSIVVALEDMYPERPLTHDLFKNLFEKLNITLRSVFIHTFAEGIFYAALECEHEGKQFELDSRASDALALAIRFGSPPVFMTDEILLEKGFEVEGEFEEDYESEDAVDEEITNWEEEINKEDFELNHSERLSTEKDLYAEYSIEELTKMMQKNIEDENYEKAAEIRDAIQRKK